MHPGARVRLDEIPTEATQFCGDKQSARTQLKRYGKEIERLAESLAAENKRSFLLPLRLGRCRQTWGACEHS